MKLKKWIVEIELGPTNGAGYIVDAVSKPKAAEAFRKRFPEQRNKKILSITPAEEVFSKEDLEDIFGTVTIKGSKK